MRPRINCISLPVESLEKSLEFYRYGIGLPTDGIDDIPPDDDHLALLLEGGLYLVLLQRNGFSDVTKLAKSTTASAGSSECILTYFASSKDEVDSILHRGANHGGIAQDSPTQEDWGYCGYIKDPDDHLWEIMYNPAMNE